MGNSAELTPVGEDKGLEAAAGPATEEGGGLPAVEDPTYYPAKQLDQQPRALVAVHPPYPKLAAREGIEGEVLVLLLLDERGKVRDATAVEATPAGYFEESTIKTFLGVPFEAAVKDGRKVKSRVLVRIRYELSDR